VEYTGGRSGSLFAVMLVFELALRRVKRKGKAMQKQTAVKNVTQGDEQAIRELVDTWLAASKKGDLTTMLSLLDDDVLFIVPGKEPFGKQAFAASNREQMKDTKMEASIDIKEIEVIGEWAWMRSFLRLTFTPAGGDPAKLSGHILTILHKNQDGRWVIKRDANFVMPESEPL
jgi:uncharacterized protein (TIGR02246 family)